MNTQPPYGQPQGPYSPPGQYPAPYGPPPRRGPSTGALVALLAAFVLVVAGGVVTTVLLVGDDDESASDEPGDTSSSQSTDELPADSTDELTDDSTDELAPEPSGDSVSGTGFSFALPSGWSDASEEATSTVNPEVDAAVAAGSSLTQSPANVMVVIRPTEGATVPGQLLPDWEAELESGTGMTAQFIPAPNVGGLETSSIQLEGVNSSGSEVVVVGFLTISNGQAYSILCTTTKTAEAESRAAFDEIIGSWQWA